MLYEFRPYAVVADEVMAFFADRLKVVLRDQGKRHDLVDAVFALGDDDLVRIVARVEALDGFLKTEDGKNLLAGEKRARQLLQAEEKKGPLPAGPAVAMSGATSEETALIGAISLRNPRWRVHCTMKISQVRCVPCRDCARPWTPSSRRCW
uniref:Uncharacterized protein n=1 Tax=Phenylobacterium glaciei TaxID=2803784 RepID=A0A974SAK9_9CAUL|nr:hypothetical protein JKL49_13795 [Phenylobacterium glaciei]